MLFLEQVPLLISYEPAVIEKGVEDGCPVIGGEVFENPMKYFSGRMSRGEKQVPDPSDGSKDFVVRGQFLAEIR
jgi:hypothetical protein